MRRNLLFVMILLVIGTFNSCKKDVVPLSSSLIGTWELSVDFNGMTGKPTYHKKGNDTTIKFTVSNYQFMIKGNIWRSGTYTVKQDSFSIDHTIKSRIIYDSETGAIRTFYDVSNNQLSFFLDAYDSPSVTYQRIK